MTVGEPTKAGQPSSASGDALGELTTAGPATARFEFEWPVDLRRTLGPLGHGGADPTIRFERGGVWLTRRTAVGPATLHITEATPSSGESAGDGSSEVRAAVFDAQAWGPGAPLALEATPGLLGAFDSPELLVAHHPLVHDLARRMPGLRLTRTGQLLPALVPAVLGQKVTATEMIRGYVGLLRRLGDAAPGPGAAMGMVVPPTGEALATLPYFDFHPLGVERRRAELVRRLASREKWVEALLNLSPADAAARLQAISGVGPWTSAEATRVAFGDPDAVSVGDAHIPDMVAWALAGEPRADDPRMLEILEPYRGQRGRVVALLEAAGVRPRRFGPRFSPGRIDSI